MDSYDRSLVEIMSSTQQHICYITKFTDKEVTCHFRELDELRIFSDTGSVFDGLMLFDGFDLFIGKEIIFDIKIGNGSTHTKCSESKESKLSQKFNYWAWKFMEYTGMNQGYL